MTMKSFVHNALIGTISAALIGAASLVTSTLPASAALSATVDENPVLKSQNNMQVAEVYDPSAGSVGFKKTKKHAEYQRGPKDKITTTCVEGAADYDIDQCYKDIKGK